MYCLNTYYYESYGAVEKNFAVTELEEFSHGWGSVCEKERTYSYVTDARKMNFG